MVIFWIRYIKLKWILLQFNDSPFSYKKERYNVIFNIYKYKICVIYLSIQSIYFTSFSIRSYKAINNSNILGPILNYINELRNVYISIAGCSISSSRLYWMNDDICFTHALLFFFTSVSNIWAHFLFWLFKIKLCPFDTRFIRIHKHHN